MHRPRQAVHSEPAEFIHLVRFTDFYLFWIDERRIQDSDPMRFLLAILPQSIPNAIELDILCFDAVFLKYFPLHRFFRCLAEFHRPRTGVPTTDFVSAMFASLVHEEIPLAIMAEEDTGHTDKINPFPQIEWLFHTSIFDGRSISSPIRLIENKSDILIVCQILQGLLNRKLIQIAFCQNASNADQRINKTDGDTILISTIRSDGVLTSHDTSCTSCRCRRGKGHCGRLRLHYGSVSEVQLVSRFLIGLQG